MYFYISEEYKKLKREIIEGSDLKEGGGENQYGGENQLLLNFQYIHKAPTKFLPSSLPPQNRAV